MLDLLKDMKKIKEDAKSATMAHPKGHTMVILYKGLPLPQKEALKRLPLYEGGPVKGVHEKSVRSENPGESSAGVSLRKGKTADAQFQHEDKLEELKKMPKPNLKGLASGGKVKGYDDGGGVSADSDQKPPVTVNVNSGPQPSNAAAQAQTPANVQQPNVQPSTPNTLLPNGSMNAPATAQVGQQANVEQAKIDAAKAQAMVPIEQARIQAQAQQAQQDQNNINALKTHADNLAANLKNIDPDAYRKNMSAPDKVATGLGLFLGGFSVPFGGQNFAGDFLNKQIDRDIDAQKANNEKQKTIWGAYKDLYGDQNLASTMAKASMADIYSGQAAQVAAKLGTPQAYANLKKVQAETTAIRNKAIMDSAGNLSAIPNNPNGGSGGSGGAGGTIPVNYQPGGRGASNPEGTQAGGPNEFSILKPGAENAVSSMIKYNPSIPDSDKAKISSQLTQAAQAEKGLHDIAGKFSSLANESKNGGASGWAHRRLSPHVLGAAGAGIGAIAGGPVGAGIGGAAGEAVGHGISAITGTSNTARSYDSDKSALTGYLSAALKGTNIGSEQIREIVDANSPEFNDDPSTLDKKLTNIREFIINHTETDALKRHGLSYR